MEQKPDNSLRPELFISIVGALSILSLFAVVPFAIGYFFYFGWIFMSFFSVVDFYFFSAVPVALSVVLLAILLFYPSLIISLTEFVLRPLKLTDLEKRLPVERQYKLGRRLAAVMLLSAIGASVVLPVVYSFLYFVVPVVLIFAYAYYARRGKLGIGYYATVFVVFELFLFSMGYKDAYDMHSLRVPIEITSKEKNFRGHLAFAGTNAVLILDDDENRLLIKLDDSSRVSLGKFKAASGTACISNSLHNTVREMFGLPCLNPQKWMGR